MIDVFDPAWTSAVPPFHAGEQAVQTRAGVAERMAQLGPRVIRRAMPEQHRELFEKLPFMILGALDDAGRPWASALTGAPGFVQSPDDRSLTFGGRPLGADMLGLRLVAGSPVGLLGIEPSTRRRNRANGVVGASIGRGLRVDVRQSFGNCPKYIQVRDFAFAPTTEAVASSSFGAGLPDEAIAMIRGADTFFIATASPDAGGASPAENGGVDVSHRGGKPGFVRVDRAPDGVVLTVPDFLGNFFFNTLGNIAANPKAGLLFVDWHSGDLLAVTGAAEVVWEGAELASFTGAQRLLRIRVQAGHRLPGAMPWRADRSVLSPQLAATGGWDAIDR